MLCTKCSLCFIIRGKKEFYFITFIFLRCPSGTKVIQEPKRNHLIHMHPASRVCVTLKWEWCLPRLSIPNHSGSGWVLQYLDMGGRFRGDDQPFLRFSIELGPYWTPLSAKNISSSLSQLVPTILGPKFGLSFHQTVLFNSFKHFVSIFFLIFDPIDPIFHWS